MQKKLEINNEANMQKSYLKILNTLYDQVKEDSKNLDLHEFKGITIAADNLFNSFSDGNTMEKLILLPKNKTEKYIKEKEYDLIKSTIYHELCHIDLANKLPILHSLHKRYADSEEYTKCFTIMIYIEYLAHLKSSNYETLKNIKRFFNSINNKKWDFDDECDCIMFIKVSPYIISRSLNKKCIDIDYIELIENEDLKKHILELKEIIYNLPLATPSDNIKDLEILEKYVSKYIKND